MPISPAHIARIHAPGSYCSGTLIGPRTVLTCAHFFRPYAGLEAITCAVAGTRLRLADLRVYAGTDIAVATLTAPVEMDSYPALGPTPAPLSPTVTFGFGGHAPYPAGRAGRFIAPLPWAVSRSFATVVRPAGIVASGAVKGDSGGPVLHNGAIFAVQSLILDPWDQNLGLATVSLTAGLDIRAR